MALLGRSSLHPLRAALSALLVELGGLRHTRLDSGLRGRVGLLLGRSGLTSGVRWAPVSLGRLSGLLSGLEEAPQTLGLSGVLGYEQAVSASEGALDSGQLGARRVFDAAH